MMTKNPIYNALAAEGYILLVAAVMTILGKQSDQDIPFLAPVLALTLFTLSSAVMGYLFILKPLRLYLDGHKQEGVKLFLQTVGVFAVITIIVFAIYFIVAK